MPGFGLQVVREQESEGDSGSGRRWGFPLKFLPSNSSSPLPAPTQLREREQWQQYVCQHICQQYTTHICQSGNRELSKVGKVKTDYLESGSWTKLVTVVQSLPLFGLQLGNKSLNFSSRQTPLCSWDIFASTNSSFLLSTLECSVFEVLFVHLLATPRESNNRILNNKKQLLTNCW